VTREAVRRRLANVMASYSAGRPSKAMLKQVLGFFLERSAEQQQQQQKQQLEGVIQQQQQ
jgi:hypothetical protein